MDEAVRHAVIVQTGGAGAGPAELTNLHWCDPDCQNFGAKSGGCKSYIDKHVQLVQPDARSQLFVAEMSGLNHTGRVGAQRFAVSQVGLVGGGVHMDRKPLKVVQREFPLQGQALQRIGQAGYGQAYMDA